MPFGSERLRRSLPLEKWVLEAVQSRYNEVAWRDYAAFIDWLGEMKASGAATPDDMAEILEIYPDPRPRQPPDLQEEEGVDSYLRDPPDPGPLARVADLGWISEERAATLRLNAPTLKRLLGFGDEEVTSDIQENSLRILGRCNDPDNWGHNRTGLVYGMVQSGKTASMISVMKLAKGAGYRLFIVLAGDKSSLRDQTQQRVNDGFQLVNGMNQSTLVHSPTWNVDFVATQADYDRNFLYSRRFGRQEDWTTIVVVKKNKFILEALDGQLAALRDRMTQEGRSFAAGFPTLILDDESDYASQNTDVWGLGSTIHDNIVDLRTTIEHNTYVGYTATPQACLSADPSDPVGYPRDFLWLLEPFMEEEDGIFTPRSYLGAWEVFWTYDHWLVRTIRRDEWPHYEKDAQGRDLGIYVPPHPNQTSGTHVPTGRTNIDRDFLEDILAGTRPVPESLSDALMDFMIATAVRWWRHWRTIGADAVPTMDAIERSYPRMAAMVHLSETQDNQGRVRDIVQREWARVVKQRESFNPATSPADHPLRIRMSAQAERTRQLRRQDLPIFDELAYFIDRCIELIEKPINNHREQPYRPYPGRPYVYLLNASDDGMEICYDDARPREIQTKRAGIFVGGNILSRGLTIEGLTVTVFGRASRMPLGDATLQMGRWFGHKQSVIDLVSVYVQDGIREVMTQVAEADRYLRLQIKDSIIHGHAPTQVLLELRNSAFFRITSPAKSTFVNSTRSVGFAGSTALLSEPSFVGQDILHNLEVLRAFENAHGPEDVHSRARLYRHVPPTDVINLLQSLRCPDDASQVTFEAYASYLQDWLDDRNLPAMPQINVAVMNQVAKRRRHTTASHPTSASEARARATNRFGPIVGGQSNQGRYKGDAFLDKDPDWHESHDNPSKSRQAGDDILIVLYRLNPNYVTKKLYVPEEERWTIQEVCFEPGDPQHVSLPSIDADDDLAVTTFAAWTPTGGPMYDVATNILIDPTQVKQVGRTQVETADAAE